MFPGSGAVHLSELCLATNQIIFTGLTYSLLRRQIRKQARKALNKAGKSRMMEELVTSGKAVIVFTDHYYAVFDTIEYTGMVLDVPEASRGKLRELIGGKQSQTRPDLSGAGPP